MQDLTPFQLFVCSSTLAIICLWTSSNQAQAQQPQQIPEQFTIQNPCVSKPTCHDCIQTPSCAWCSEPTFTNPRCFQPSYPTAPEDRCATKYIYNPDNEMGFISNLSLSRSRLHSQSGGGAAGSSGGGWGASGSSSGGSFGSSGGSFGSSGGSWEEGQGTTQITPQRISITLRARQSFSIQMYYTQAEDYPVDLYYLMDLSKSMEDDKEKLYKLGDHLVATMQNVTSKFTVGFGSFVDKVVMPYVSTLPEKLQHPCSGCVAPYGFRNHMTLSTNTKTFSHMVNEATVSGNLDAPEGGFDAIMQAVVCRKEIGWREKARRLLVFSTDAGFHYAGDGKLGGIVKPNDGRCHLDQRGYYTMSSLQDYPSISQINLYVKRNAINVIFAVTSDKIDIYKQLQSHIEGASCGTLSNDSSNIVELIKEQYEAISSTVEMKHNASSAVSVRFFTKCLNSNGPMTETGKCGSIKVGDLIEFRIELEVLKCPKDPADWKQTIQIYPVGINESLIIDLTMLCSCPCEQPGDPLYVPNSEVCHGAGTYMCGTCQCHPNSFGRFCECQKNAVTTSSNITMNCKSPLNNLECSGRGTCLCGECACEVRNRQNEHVYGDYCECDDFSCARHNGKLCSGPEHGRCDCGKCVCTNDWTRDDCSCPVSKANCFAPGVENGTVCSGNGVCECGVCKCNVTESGRFSGKFCETCPTCESKCDTYKACVQCHVYGTGPYSEKECNTNCTEFVPIRAKVIEVDEKNNENLCAYYDEDDCRFTFVYYYKDKAIAIRALEERECPPEVFLLGIVFGVIAAVVLMGLAILLLWKLLTTIHDRREFARFEKERMMAKWDTGENPIYKQATSTFKNPTYAGKG